MIKPRLAERLTVATQQTFSNAFAGAAIATGGVICGALGGAAAGCLGATAIQAFAMGALSFNFTAMVIAPLYGFEMQPIEYKQQSYNTNQPIF